MTGFQYSFTGNEVDEEGKELNNSSELKKSNDLTDISLIAADDFDLSLSFADSFIDYDCIKEWILDNNVEAFSMDDVKPDAGEFGTEKAEIEIVEKCIAADADSSLKDIEILENLDSHSVGPIMGSNAAAASNNVEACDSGVFRDIKVEDPAVVNPLTKILASSINEEFVKVKLEDESERLSDGEVIREANSAAKDGEMECLEVDGNETRCGFFRGNDDVNDCKNAGMRENVIVIPDVEGTGMLNVNKDDSDHSSSESSGSEDNSSDDSEEDDEADEEAKMEDGEIREADADEMVAWSAEEDVNDIEEASAVGPIRSKNELKDLPHVPPVNITLEPHHQTLPVGVVLSVIGTQVLVEGMEKHNPLNEGSILWVTEKRLPLGIVDEIFGPVKNPFYIVRYNSESEVPDSILQGTLISFVSEFASHILNSKNLYKKGYDASGENDEELTDEAEFSDDEKEAEYKRKLKMSKRGSNGQKDFDVNDEKFRNRKMDGKKLKNRGGNWKNNRHSPTSEHHGMDQRHPGEQGQSALPFSAPVEHGHFSTPTQGFVGGQGLYPPLSQVAQTNCLVSPSNSVWQQGIPFQQPQNMGFPNEFPTNIMPLLQLNQPLRLNQPRLPYQMPLMGGVPFPQQVNMSQALPPNFALPAGQLNFSTVAPFAPMPFGQIGVNQTQFVMGLHGQHTAPPLNAEGSRIPSNVVPAESSSNMQPQSFVPGSFEASRSSNQGAHPGRGRKPYPMSGGRGRRQFNR